MGLCVFTALRVLFLSLLFFSLPLYSHTKIPEKSYAWKKVENTLDINRGFGLLAQDLNSSDIASVQGAKISEKCRQVLYNASKLTASLDHELSSLVVSSCAYSGLGFATDLMDHVLDVRAGYDYSSWLCAMQYLSKEPTARACDTLFRCLGLPYKEIAFAAGYYLSQNPYARSNTELVDRILAIDRRLSSTSSLWICSCLSQFDNQAASRAIARIYNQNPPEIQASILQMVAESKISGDELLDSALSQTSPTVQEALLYYYLLHAKSGSSLLEYCKKMATNPNSRVSTLAAILGIINSTKSSYIDLLEKKIKAGDLHAISGCGLLAKLKNSGLEARLTASLLSQLQNTDDLIRLNASIALLEALNSESLPILEPLFTNSNLFVTANFQNSYSWPTYELIQLSDPKSPLFQYQLLQQMRARQWLLEKIHRLPLESTLPWYEELLSSDEGAVHFLISSKLAQVSDEKSLATLRSWSETPAKPWLRIGSHLSLWRLNREKDSLKALEHWITQNPDEYSSFVTAISSADPLSKEREWASDFQTQVMLEIAQELIQNGEISSWQALCKRISHSLDPLQLLPLIALMSKEKVN